MKGDKSDLTTLLRETIDDERLYRQQFSASAVPGKHERDADALKAALEDEAEKIERTVGCVTAVVDYERGRMGPTDYRDIVLLALVPRHTDVDYFERVCEEAAYRAREAAYQHGDDDD